MTIQHFNLYIYIYIRLDIELDIYRTRVQSTDKEAVRSDKLQRNRSANNPALWVKIISR